MNNESIQLSTTNNIYKWGKIAVLIPCYNEALTIKKVINDFRQQLPTATIYVYDNNSSDHTSDIAKAEGAVVVHEKRQGKGFVVASMFEDIEADIYVMVDGDDTYPADKVHELIHPIIKGKADMVVGNRLVEYADQSFRLLHVLGNRLVVKTVNMIFNSRLCDIMSGYRAFNRKFVKRIPLISKGFEVETQLTIQSLYHNFVIAEVPIPYGKRPEGSYSKLSTFSDGAKVLVKIFDIFKAYRPLLFFSIIGFSLFILSMSIGSIAIVEFILTGKILHLPSAVLAAAIMIISIVSFTCGIILSCINYRINEVVRLVTTGNYVQENEFMPSKTEKSNK